MRTRLEVTRNRRIWAVKGPRFHHVLSGLKTISEMPYAYFCHRLASSSAVSLLAAPPPTDGQLVLSSSSSSSHGARGGIRGR